VHILVVGYYAPRLGFRTLTLVQISTAAALALSTFWWVETPMIRWRPGVVIALLVTGLLATALAFGVQAGPQAISLRPPGPRSSSPSSPSSPWVPRICSRGNC